MMNLHETALQLTAYDRYGSISRADYIAWYFAENVEFTASDIGDYNEYLSEQGYEGYYDDLDEMLYGMTPTDAVRCVYFGHCNLSDDYFQFNGYANIDSFTEREVLDEMAGDKDFCAWYADQNDLIDWDEADEAIAAAHELLARGY